jgi:hypothetical protein
MPNYDIECADCQTISIEFRKYEDRDNPGVCNMCLGPTNKVYRTAPNGMFTALPDGTRRNEGYQRLKEAAKLEKEAANTRPERRKEINQEMNKLRSTK